MSAIFLSHSSHDHAWASTVLAWLLELDHHSVFLDFDEYEGIRAGADWEQTIYKKLRDCSAVICLVSPRWVSSKWCFAEVTQARALGKLIIPLVIEPTDESSPFPDVQLVRFATLSTEEAKSRLAIVLDGARLSKSFPYDPSRGPYPGFPTFEEADAGVFFGRDREIEECLDRIRRLSHYAADQSRLLLILGPSGAGKSSLLRAGVIPRLRRAASGWILSDPIRPSADTAVKALAVDAAEAPNSASAQHVLFVDQLEEALLTGAHESHFLAALRHRLDASEGRVIAVATLRSDSLGLLQSSAALRGFRQYEQFRLDFMDRQFLRELIEKPAARANVSFETVLGRNLVDHMLGAASGGAALPVLAFCLRQMYQSAVRDGREEIRFADYDAIDGLEGAVRATAEQNLMDLSATDADRRAFFEWITWNLVQLNDDGRLLRQRGKLSDVPASVSALVDRFVESRLLTKGTNEGETTVEVAHEAMLNAWPVFTRWLDDHRALLLWRKRVTQDLLDWENSARRRAFLLRGGKLAEAVKWRDLYPSRLESRTNEFVESSIRWNRIVTTSLAAAGVIAFVALGVATVFARMQADLAARQSLVSQSERLAAESRRTTAEDTDRSALLAVAAATVADTPAATAALLDLEHNPSIPDVVVQTADAILSMAYSPKGDLVAMGHKNGIISLWATMTWQRRNADLHGPAGEVECLAFSPDGSRLVSCHNKTLDSGLIVAWDVATGLPRRQPLSAHKGGIRTLSVSHNGLWLATGGDTFDRTVRLWSMNDLSPIGAPVGVNEAAHVAFTADGQQLGVGTQQGYLFLFRLPDLEPVTPTRSLGSSVRSIAFDPRGDWLVVGQQDGAIRFIPVTASVARSVTSAKEETDSSFTAHRGPVEAPIRSHKGAVWCVAFSPDGKIVVSGSVDGTVRLWHTDTRQPLTPAAESSWGVGTNIDPESGAFVDDYFLITPEPLGSPLLTVGRPADFGLDYVRVAFSPDGRTLLTSFRPTTFQVWTGFSEPAVRSGRKLWSRDDMVGNLLATARGSKVTLSRASSTGTQDMTIWNDEDVSRVQLDTAGTRVLIAGESAMRIVDPTSAQLGPARLPVGVAQALSSDGATVAVGDEARQVTLYTLPEGRIHGTPIRDIAADIAALALSGSVLAIGREDGVAQVIDAPNGRERCRTEQPSGPVRLVALSPDEQQMATAYADHQIRIWSTRTCIQVGGTLAGHTDSILAIRFSPSGRRLSSSSDDKTTRIWDLGTTQPLGAPLETRQPAETIAFTAEDTLVVSTESYGRQQFSLAPSDLSASVCRRTRRNFSIDEWRAFFGDANYQRVCKDLPIHPSFLAAATRSAREGRLTEAIEAFRVAKIIDPNLEIDADRAAMLAYNLGEGERLARRSDLDAATEMFHRAQVLDPTAVGNPKATARRIVISTLVEQIYRLARQNQVDEAIAAMKRVQALAHDDPGDVIHVFPPGEDQTHLGKRLADVITGDADTFVRRLAVESLVSEAKRLAALGNIEEAERKFAEAGKFESRYQDHGRAEALRIAVETLTRDGRAAFARGDEETARRAFSRAKSLGPEVAVDPDSEMERLAAGKALQQARDWASSGNADRAVAALEEALRHDRALAEKADSMRRELRAAAMMTAAQKKARDGDIASATKMFRDALSENPGLNIDPVAEARSTASAVHRSEAKRLLDSGRRDEALRELRKIAAIDPSFAMTTELSVLSVPHVDEEGREAFRVYLKKSGSKAFVISELGSFGWAAEYDSMEEAISRAMGECTKGGVSRECTLYAKGNDVVWKKGR